MCQSRTPQVSVVPGTQHTRHHSRNVQALTIRCCCSTNLLANGLGGHRQLYDRRTNNSRQHQLHHWNLQRSMPAQDTSRQPQHQGRDHLPGLTKRHPCSDRSCHSEGVLLGTLGQGSDVAQGKQHHRGESVFLPLLCVCNDHPFQVCRSCQCFSAWVTQHMLAQALAC